MYRAEWMYKVLRAGNDLTFLHHVTKFVAVVKKHRTSLGREGTICPCNRCKNNLVYEDSVVKSHLIRYGFVDNYTIWKFHGEVDSSATGASERNSSMTTTSSVNERGQQPSSSTAARADSDTGNHDYVKINELLQDMAANDGDGDCDEQSDFLGPEDAEIFENLANRMDQDDVLFGNPKWLENFKEMK